jgi:hypothetical protein
MTRTVRPAVQGARGAGTAGTALRPPRRLSRYARQRVWALIALVAVGAPLFLWGGRHWVGHVDVDEAVARFRAAGPAAAEPVPGLPAPGVYRYRTTGGERVSFLDYRRDYTDTTVRIVTRRGCGIREEQWFLVQHLEYYDRCGDALVSYGTDIAYWWTHGTQDFRCPAGGSFDMAGRVAGDKVRWSCHDEDTRAEQLTEFLGVEEVMVDGRRHQARHVRWTTTFSGATVGSAVVDDWFSAINGLVLREKRIIGLKVGSPFVGRIDYVDQSEYTLLSTEPVR